MTLFRGTLALFFVVLAGYTGVVFKNHGADLFSVFFGSLPRLDWPGQFNLDFLMLLTLSGLWVAYRHRFSARGIALGACAAVGGVLFLSVYLLVLSMQVRGDMKALLLGEAER